MFELVDNTYAFYRNPLGSGAFWTDIGRQGGRGRKNGGNITSRFTMSCLASLPRSPLAGFHTRTILISRVDPPSSALRRPPQPLVSPFALLVQHNALEEYPSGISTPNLSDFRSRYAIRHSHPRTAARDLETPMAPLLVPADESDPGHYGREGKFGGYI